MNSGTCHSPESVNSFLFIYIYILKHVECITFLHLQIDSSHQTHHKKKNE